MTKNTPAKEAILTDPGLAIFSRMAISPPSAHKSNLPETAKEDSDNVNGIISPGCFSEKYQKEERLQSGSYGIVYKASRVDHRDDDANDQKFAVKVIDRTKLKNKEGSAVFQEVGILKELVDAPNVITLVDFYVEPSCLYVVQQLAAGGDLFHRLAQRKTYTEQLARELARGFLRALQHIHARNILHRDLKPANLLLASGNDDCHILLADFGFATHVPKDGYCRTRLGTPLYVAPEIVMDVPYTTKADMWSTGCILYLLLGGLHPFDVSNLQDLFHRIRAANFTFYEKSWGNVSIPAKQLIVQFLTVNPKYRWTAGQALESPWMKATSSALCLHENDLSESLNNLRGRLRLKAAMDAVRWATTASFWNPEKVTFHHELKTGDNSLLFDSNDGPTITGSTPPTSRKGFESGMPSPPQSPIKTKSFENSYTLLRKVRKGDFVTVWECQHIATQDVFVVKVIPRSALRTKHDEEVLNEVSILQSVCSDAPELIVGLKDFFEEQSAFFIVMELMEEGDLLDQVAMRSHYSECDARALVKQLLKAVDILHKRGVAHRDIKPQSLLLSSNDGNGKIKLGDFGFARRVHTPQSLTQRIGTPPYVAPEILKNIPHDERVDMWSVGVTIFVLLVGYPPFALANKNLLCRQIKTGVWGFHEPDWRQISPEAKQLIQGLLQVDPLERLSAAAALQSDWVRQMSDETLAKRELSGALNKLKRKRGDLRAAASKTLTWLVNDKGNMLQHKFVSKPITTPTKADECIVEDSTGNFEVNA